MKVETSYSMMEAQCHTQNFQRSVYKRLQSPDMSRHVRPQHTERTSTALPLWKLRISLLEGCRAPCLPISSVAGDAVATIGQAAAVMIVVSHLDLDHLAARCCSANVSEAFPLFTYIHTHTHIYIYV